MTDTLSPQMQHYAALDTVVAKISEQIGFDATYTCYEAGGHVAYGIWAREGVYVGVVLSEELADCEIQRYVLTDRRVVEQPDEEFTENYGHYDYGINEPKCWDDHDESVVIIPEGDVLAAYNYTLAPDSESDLTTDEHVIARDIEVVETWIDRFVDTEADDIRANGGEDIGGVLEMGFYDNDGVEGIYATMGPFWVARAAYFAAKIEALLAAEPATGTCGVVREGTLGYQRCVRPTHTDADKHRSQDGKRY